MIRSKASLLRFPHKLAIVVVITIFFTVLSMLQRRSILGQQVSSVLVIPPSPDLQPPASTRPCIPHIIWFTYKYNILQAKTPRRYYNNILKTIYEYHKEWNESQLSPVYFLDDNNCTMLLKQVDSIENTRLSDAFANETRGCIKADLCRIAALFLHGGYYFDVDLEVVQPVRLTSDVSFSTVRDGSFGYFFQAFLAASPGHPVIRANLHTLADAYFTKNESCMDESSVVLGPCTLHKAWQLTTHSGISHFFDEIDLKEQDDLYPNVTRRGKGRNCNWVVHDADEHVVYFYSRIVGSAHCKKGVNVTAAKNTFQQARL